MVINSHCRSKEAGKHHVSVRREGSRPHIRIPILKGWLQRGWKLSLHKDEALSPHRGQVTVDTGCTGYRKGIFTVKATSHWNNLPGDVVEAPSVEVFRMQFERVLGNLIQTDMNGIFRGLFKPGLFWINKENVLGKCNNAERLSFTTFVGQTQYLNGPDVLVSSCGVPSEHHRKLLKVFY